MRHRFANKPVEEIIPNYKDIVAACEIKEDEFIEAMVEYDEAMKE